MPIYLGSTERTEIYLGDIPIQKVYLGDALVYSLFKLTRPNEGSYPSMGVIAFHTDGTIKIGPRYHDPVNTLLGYWRNLSLTPSASDVWSIYVEKLEGDLEPDGYSDALNTWHQLYPASSGTLFKWSSNNGGAGAAILRITMRDQNNNQIVWYAKVKYGGTGIVDYDLITLSGDVGDGTGVGDDDTGELPPSKDL